MTRITGRHVFPPVAVIALLTTLAGAQSAKKAAGIDAGPTTGTAQRLVDEGTVIENVTLISPERATPLLHAAVVIRDGRIRKIGTNLDAGPYARRIDGTGRFLIPGLIDSHVHVGHSAALDDNAIDAHPELWIAYRARFPAPILRSALRRLSISTSHRTAKRGLKARHCIPVSTTVAVG